MSERGWGEEGELQTSLNEGAHGTWGGEVTFLMSAEEKVKCRKKEKKKVQSDVNVLCIFLIDKDQTFQKLRLPAMSGIRPPFS